MKTSGSIAFAAGIIILSSAFADYRNLKEKKDKAAGVAEIRFTHKAGEQVLKAEIPYINISGEEFSVSRFKYYISNIEFGQKNSTTLKAKGETYFLIDDEDESSKNLNISVPAGLYNSISFTLGVDSLRNVSGAQKGALDPLNGMFWTWNSGYIMAKLEGKSPASSLPGNMFEYHIGGFKGKDNVLKKITLPFPGGAEKKISNDKKLVIEISVNLLEWFQHPEKISIASNPACTTPGTLAKKISDNYADMFSISFVNE